MRDDKKEALIGGEYPCANIHFYVFGTKKKKRKRREIETLSVSRWWKIRGPAMAEVQSGIDPPLTSVA